MKKKEKVIARPTSSRHARHDDVNLLPALELRMSSRMSADFRWSELLLELGFAHGDGIIGTSSTVIVMNPRLHIRSKVRVMRSPSLDSQTTPIPGAPVPPTKDLGNEFSRNLNQQAGLMSGKDRHCTVGSKPTLRANPRSVRYQTYSSLFTPTPRHRRRPLPRLVPAKAISAGLDGLPESDQAARVEFNEK
jgi:hypothetical protein